jgi:hypothetical protein
MKTVVYLLLAGLIFLQLPASVAAQQTGSMSCRNGIVSINDTIPDVVKKCGLPAFQDRREETFSGGQRHGRSYEIIAVDDWIYNFGPQEFMYEVTFQNGRVAKIESLDHGY